MKFEGKNVKKFQSKRSNKKNSKEVCRAQLCPEKKKRFQKKKIHGKKRGGFERRWKAKRTETHKEVSVLKPGSTKTMVSSMVLKRKVVF